MRKSFLLLAGAAAVLASCSETETLDMAETASGIRFDGAYIGYATETRSINPTKNITEFWVYGQYSKDEAANVSVFDNTKVSNSNDTWSYEGGLRPWIDGAEYTFAAYAPENAVSVSGMNEHGYLTFEYTSNAVNQKDLLYAAHTQNGKNSENTPISLTFKHLLSIVQFTFKSGFDESSKVTVKNIKVTGINTKATFTGNAITQSGDENFGGSWAAAETTGEFSLNNLSEIEAAGSSDNIIVIPQSISTVSVTFDVDVTDTNGQSVMSKTELSATLPTSTTTSWVMGYKYNYVATIDPESVDLEYIEFKEAKVDAWKDGTGGDLDVQDVQ